MDHDAIRAVIDQYVSHGWQLRRALVSAQDVGIRFPESASEGAGVEVIASENEALWFSRRSLPDREAWELRRLSGSPFALVVVIEDSLDVSQRETVLSETVARMFDGTHPEPTSH